jgi:hypothetical protein
MGSIVRHTGVASLGIAGCEATATPGGTTSGRRGVLVRSIVRCGHGTQRAAPHVDATTAPAVTMTAMGLRFDQVLLVGDVHANQAWWDNVVVPTAEERGVDAIVQLGDFGWWPNAGSFRRGVRAGSVPTWFLDGNHEHFPDLAEVVGHARRRQGITDLTTPVQLKGNLGYLPRGSRFVVGGAAVVCVGGARSIDRAFRTLGKSFFHQECLDDGDVERATAAGRAEVLLSHDAPAGWPIPGLLDGADLPVAWRGERPKCEEHRALLRQVFVAVEPRRVVHGHYHSAYLLEVAEPWGTVSVDGLDCDGGRHSLAVLHCVDGVAVVERLER